MLNKEIIIKRLALIKQLYKIGVEQSKQVESIASFSLLSFHDSIEMFFLLIAEKENIKTDGLSFMDYWNKFPNLTLRESIRALKDRRVNIKHKGLLPSKSDIEISRINANDFFKQNTPIFFDIDFDEIALYTLIEDKNLRKYLEEAQKALDDKKYQIVIEKTSVAFNELLFIYEENKTNDYESPFHLGKDMRFSSSFTEEIRDKPKLVDFVKRTSDSLNKIQKRLKIISFGIDYKKYIKFDLLTPVVSKTLGGEYVLEMFGKKIWSKENCQYCIDFVTDCCLKLQEFNFDIQEIEEELGLDLWIEE